MIESTYKPFAELKTKYRETEQARRKREYDQKKLTRKLARMGAGGEQVSLRG
jgi:hypothetical protein